MKVISSAGEFRIPNQSGDRFYSLRICCLGLLLGLSTLLIMPAVIAQSTKPAEKKNLEERTRVLEHFAAMMDSGDQDAMDLLVPKDLPNRQAYLDFLKSLQGVQAQISILRKKTEEKYGKEAVSAAGLFKSSLPEAGVKSILPKAQWKRSGPDMDLWIASLPHGDQIIQVPVKKHEGHWSLDVQLMTKALGGVDQATALFTEMKAVMTQGEALLENSTSLTQFNQELNKLTMQRMSALRARAIQKLEEEQVQKELSVLRQLPIQFTGQLKPSTDPKSLVITAQKSFTNSNTQAYMSLFKAESVHAQKVRLFYGTLSELYRSYLLLQLAAKTQFDVETVKQIRAWDTMAGNVVKFYENLKASKTMVNESRAYVFGPNNEPLLVLTKDKAGWWIDAETLGQGLEHIEVELRMLDALSKVFGQMAVEAARYEDADAFLVALKMKSTAAIAPYVAELSRLKRGQ